MKMKYLFITFLLVVNVVCASKEFKVGDSEGWREPSANESSLYSQWAGNNRFHVGDSLFFKYTNDSVLQVDKFGYYHCNKSHHISKFKNGNNVFHLHKPGPAYYISGNSDHCKNGQRLFIEVMVVDRHVSHSPPSIANPPFNPTDVVASAPSPHSGSCVETPVSLVTITVAVTLFYAIFHYA